jgi:glycine/D-amino acid oxidase-like deaminating enzyme
MAGFRSLSLWHDTLPEADMLSPRAALPGDRDADVAIVGAGFTGLWTAHYLLERDPTVRIVVLERNIAGFGASGRNGGWASALLPMSLDTISKSHGREAAIRMRREMNSSVDEVGRAAVSLGIDCQYVKGGQIELIRNPAQEARARATLTDDARFGLDDHVWLGPSETAERVRATHVVGAVYTPHCAAIHPARLVRGLADSVEARGVRIHEQTAATAIEPGRVLTDLGSVRAPIIVRATEGFTPELRGEKRTLVPIYSLMIATEPLADAVWGEIGLDHRETFNDGRHLIIYGQRTADGRLAFGGRGAPYHFGSSIKPAFDRDQRVHEMLRETLIEMFPPVRDARITHRWGGALGLPRDWHCGVGLDRATGLAWAGGYVGDGVTATNLAGRTLADLITARSSDLTSLPWVGHRSRQWEPEPIRWVSIRTSLRLPVGADRYEQRHHRPERLRSWLLGKLTHH